ncbi:MAG: hypothetical protein ACREQN_10300 [Candidatus Binataceae bacterium]
MADQRALLDMVKHQAADSRHAGVAKRLRLRFMIVLGLFVFITCATELLSSHLRAHPNSLVTQSHGLSPH